MEEREATLILMSAEVGDRKALKEEAKGVLREYLKASPGDKWSLTTPTYQSKVDEEAFLEAAAPWNDIIKSFKIKSVEIQSGVQVAVKATLTIANGKTADIKVPMTKEIGVRTPSLEADLKVDGRNAPPYWQTPLFEDEE